MPVWVVDEKMASGSGGGWKPATSFTTEKAAFSYASRSPIVCRVRRLEIDPTAGDYYNDQEVQMPNQIRGASFASTGTLANWTRNEFAEEVSRCGGWFDAQPNPSTNYLVVGKRTASKKKIDTCQRWGVKVIDEQMFLDMARGVPTDEALDRVARQVLDVARVPPPAVRTKKPKVVSDTPFGFERSIDIPDTK